MARHHEDKKAEIPELPLEDRREATPRVSADGDPSDADSAEDLGSRTPALFEFGQERRGRARRTSAQARGDGRPAQERRGTGKGESHGAGAEEGRGVDSTLVDEAEGADDAESFLRIAARAAAAGETDRAVAAYRRALHLDPENVKARNNLGILLDAAGDHEAAFGQFEVAAELSPDNPEVLTNMSAALAGLGKYAAAEQRLRQVLRLEPARIDAQVNLGILFFRRGLYAQAEVELQRVCQQDSGHATAHFYRGEALNRLGRVDEALTVLERARELKPDSARIYYLTASCTTRSTCIRRRP
ncbi:MAG: tetratricopeptide repeat protein [Gemmatimonadota bacterium]